MAAMPMLVAYRSPGLAVLVAPEVAACQHRSQIVLKPVHQRNSFSESPSLNDVVTWTGSTSVAEVSDAGMSAYDTDKIEYNNVTEVDLSIAGSTWFKVSSEADYGYDKAFPAGTYRTVVSAECIAI